MTSVRIGALDQRHRGRLAEILAATAVFSQDEIGVALELFDETFEVGSGRWEGRDEGAESPSSHLPPPSSSYEFVGGYADDDTLVGFACYGPTPSTEGTFDLYWIAVDPARQGTGEGSRLLREIERRLRHRGARLLIVETSSRPAYTATRRFYDARGYRETARVADFYAPADDRMIYTKRLAASDLALAT